jgi:geranylgeranyl pyrophosphate synthase
VQIDAIGNYFESVGLAFQIIDDVLNLRGFKGNLKTKAEDISHGKVTLPFVKALGALDRTARADFASRWMAKPTEERELSALVEIVEQAGALDACVKEASSLVEDAWKALDPVVEDSLAKIMLRAFGWYVLERHY